MDITKEQFKNYKKAVKKFERIPGEPTIETLKKETGLNQTQISLIRGWEPVLEKKYK